MSIRILSAAFLIAASAANGATGDDNTITLRASGEGQWQVWCSITPRGSDAFTRFLEPGRDTFSSRTMQLASCNYKNASAGALTISVDGPSWQCPFPLTADGKCEQSFRASAFGAFDLRHKH
jgi:hypothetical protein